ncbi:MAG TPA: GFA family protein [Candidatus Angelobacter sp.]|nr:GFA family protein [Candidatus Angelobacter sp.]
MQLAGSCFCGAVRFTVDTRTPYPYRRCYCARCRKTAGGTGAAANLLAQASTLTVEGADAITEFSAPDTTRTRFCSRCGSALYLTIDAASDFVYPFASAIDTPLPEPLERVHVFTSEAPAWARPPSSPDDYATERNTRESISDWHRRHRLTEPE